MIKYLAYILLASALISSSSNFSINQNNLHLQSQYSQQKYTKVIHSTDPQALCLDGTPPILYYHEGGGFCTGMTLQETLQDCYKRSKTDMGSSKYWPENIDSQAQGCISTDQNTNDFAGYVKIIIGYCDSSLHQGYRQKFIEYKGEKMYFRGAAVTRSHFQWIINKYPNFVHAQQIIVSGSSAGGIAAYLWTNYVQSLVSKPENVVSIPDSGAFIITKTYTNIQYVQTIVQNLYKFSNLNEQTPLTKCNNEHQGKQHLCLFIQNAWKYMESRVLLINSQYDSWSLYEGLQMRCMKPGRYQYSLQDCNQQEIYAIEQYRGKYKKFIQEFLENDDQENNKNNVWSLGCCQHGYNWRNQFYNSLNERVPATTGYTIRNAMNKFIQGEKVHAQQASPWPSNVGCAL